MKREVLLIAATFVGCVHGGGRTPAPVPVPPAQVQVLVQADSQLNLSREREPWAVWVTLYVLKAEPDEELEFKPIVDDAEKILGESLAGPAKLFQAYPGTSAVQLLDVPPGTSHILAVAAFREPIGTYWYQTYEIPTVRSAEDSPCFYLGLERSEIGGGVFPPPGFDTTAFSVACASVLRRTAPSEKKQKRQRPGEPPARPEAPPGPPTPPDAAKPPTLPSLPKEVK